VFSRGGDMAMDVLAGTPLKPLQQVGEAADEEARALSRTSRRPRSAQSSIIHVEFTLEIPGTPVIRIPAQIMMAPAVVIAAPPPIVPLMPPSLDHALIGHGLIGDATRGHRACRRQRHGLHAAGECTGQKGRGT
jgi:hypothetical protein